MRSAILPGALMRAALLQFPVTHESRAADDAVRRHIAATILRLLSGSGPTAIARLVMAVVVDALNLVTRRWLIAHVCVEQLEVHPALAHANAASAVVGVRDDVGIQTPRFHGRPRSVFGRVHAAMLKRARPATAARQIALNAISVGHDLFSASAQAAVVVRVTCIDVRHRQDGHSVNHLARQINMRRHDAILPQGVSEWR